MQLRFWLGGEWGMVASERRFTHLLASLLSSRVIRELSSTSVTVEAPTKVFTTLPRACFLWGGMHNKKPNSYGLPTNLRSVPFAFDPGIHVKPQTPPSLRVHSNT